MSNKTKSSHKICHKEGDRTISDDAEVVNILNNHFIGSVCSLAEAGGCSEQVLDYKLLEDPIENVVHHFKHHPSIIAINEKEVWKYFWIQLCWFRSHIRNKQTRSEKKQPLG